jgi:hypothetical protein
MDPDKNELSDSELHGLLQTWEAPAAPASLRSAVFPQARTLGWWARFWHARIHVPAPAICLLTLVVALALWKWSTPRVVVQTQRVEVPVTQVVTVYRDRVINAPAAESSRRDLHPVSNVRPRIIRSTDLEN